jgi:arachidonate 15-lipoxygenase
MHVLLTCPEKSCLGTGRLFVCDYTGGPGADGKTPDWALPSNIVGGADGDSSRALPRPLAFFYWDIDKDCLLPLAVQLDGRSRVYTPADKPYDWIFAKMCVQIADSNHHELSSHLARTHFVMEPFAVSTQRMLPEGHPLNLLLVPHMRFMIANNELGRRFLVSEGGAIDTLLCASAHSELSGGCVLVNASFAIFMAGV